MAPVYHQGELAVQRRADVQEIAARTGGVLRSAIPPVARDFLVRQPMAVVSSLDAHGQPWASLLAGEPGFLKVLDEQTLSVRAEPATGDPLSENLRRGGPLGLLAIELATRRRAKLKGQAAPQPDGSFVFHIDRVYALCPNYIQAREVSFQPALDAMKTEVISSDVLTDAQAELVSRADTFFIATFNVETGADASHRGGRPGFVRVTDRNRLEFPDYSGNKMFNTLGNISVNPSAGLLFIDFETGQTLQLAGRATVVWDPARAAAFPGAERVVEFDIEQVVQSPAAARLRWRFLNYSPVNPG